MEQALYVITHKEVKNIYPKDRKIMLVGAKSKTVPMGYCSDYAEMLPNISDKNANYCELTGLYYFYKNDAKADVLGLEHYRRLFVKRKLYLFKYPFLCKKDIVKILREYDIIVPKSCCFNTSVYDQYAGAHIVEDFDKVIAIIKKEYPEYTDCLEKVLHNNQAYFCNMFIAKAEVIKEYCDWLFGILFELEKDINLSDRDDYQKRVFGFLSERMFSIWLAKNQQLKKYECRVEFIESNVPMVNMMKKIRRKICHVFR